MNKDTSPQVHPTGVEHGFNNGVAGMTLLQYYAGQALAGLLASPMERMSAKCEHSQYAAASFSMADSMLAEYNKRYGATNE